MPIGRASGVVLAGFLILVGPSREASAQVYKCKDAAGRIVYSGQPCEYDAKPLSLPENSIQGSRSGSGADPYGVSPGNQASRSSSEEPAARSQQCIAMQSELTEWAAKPLPRDTAGAAQQRRKVTELTKSYDLQCGTGGMSPGTSARNVTPGSKSECAQISYRLREESSKPTPVDMTDALRHRQRVKQLRDAYQAMMCSE